MKQYTPKRTGIKDYNGFRLTDKYLLFSNQASEELRKFNSFDVSFDEKTGIVEINKGVNFLFPKNSKLNSSLAEDTGLTKGRYLKIGEKTNKLIYRHEVSHLQG